MAQKYCVFILHLLKNPTAPSHTIPNSLFAACCSVKNLFFLCQPVFVDFFVVSVELVLLVVVLLVMVLLVLPCGRNVNNHESPSTAKLQ